MRPKVPVEKPKSELFYIRLDVVCDPTNSLVKLADRIDWDGLDEQFASLYAEEARPAKQWPPTGQNEPDRCCATTPDSLFASQAVDQATAS